jgi:zinc protease
MNTLPNAANIARTVLSNGITVLVYENFAAQSVVISGSLRVGSMYETPNKNGLASLVANSLMRGTQSRDFNTIASSLEDIGADLDVNAGVHRTGFGGKALAEDLPLLVDLLADVLRHPTFPEAQVERLRGEILTGLQIRSQDTRYRAGRAFAEALYPTTHPYHYSARGTLQTLPTLTLDDMRAFHRHHYGPEGMIIVVVGAVKAADAVAIVRQKLEDWHNIDQPAAITLPSIHTLEQPQRIFVPLAGKTQADLVLGTYGPSRYEPDYLAAMLANCVLGQFGMMGRIGASVREELGLAYYAYSSMDGGMGPNPWSVTAGVNPANVELALGEIVKEIRRITEEPVSSEDLSNVQSFFVGRLPLQLESNEGIAGSIVNMELYQLGLDYLTTYGEKLYALTTDELLAATRRYLHPELHIIGISGPDTPRTQ